MPREVGYTPIGALLGDTREAGHSTLAGQAVGTRHRLHRSTLACALPDVLGVEQDVGSSAGREALEVFIVE